MSNSMFEPKPFDRTPIGGKSGTGAIRISEDSYISEWVYKGAPFRAREANAMSNLWRVDNQHGQLMIFGMTEAEAERTADRLNLQAAHAILVKR